MKMKLMCVVMCLALTCSFASAADEVVGTDQDNFLWETSGDTGTNFGATIHMVLGLGGAPQDETDERRPILHFDLSSYNGGPLVTAAGGTLALTLKTTQGGSVDRVIDLYAIASAEAGWIEGTKNNAPAATGESAWDWHDRANAWTGGGGLGAPGGAGYGATPLDSYTVVTDTVGEVFTWTISKAVLDAWITDSANNAGLIITEASHANGTIMQLASKEHGTPSYRPTLSFDLNPPQWGGTPGSGGVSGDWDVATNWLDEYKPVAGDIANIDYPGSQVTLDTAEEVLHVKVGVENPGLNQLDIITNGSLTVSGIFNVASLAGMEGEITVSGDGSLDIGDEFWLGSRGLGTLTMSDTATVTITNDLIIARQISGTADAVGDLQLHGGTLTAGGLQWGPDGGNARLDIIPGATLVIAGDQTAASWIDLIDYSISPGDGLGHKSAVYDGSTWTTITSTTPEPATIGLLALGAVGLLRRRRRSWDGSAPRPRDPGQAKRMKTTIASVVVVLLLVITARSGAELRGDFAKQWVRSHPFSLLGWNDHLVGSQYFTFEADFTGAGLNTNATYSPLIASVGSSAGLPWHARLTESSNLTGPDLGPGGDDYNAAALTKIDGFLSVQRTLPQSDIGWIVIDEPTTTGAMDKAGWMADYLKTNYSQSLVYANATTNASLDEFVSRIQPDVLMYDRYTVTIGPMDIPKHLSDAMLARNKALSVGIPYWSWTQSFGEATMPARLPSESEMRTASFSLLAAGYTGIGYFTYSQGGWDDALMNDNGPSDLYAPVADANAEIMNLGPLLRFLTSSTAGGGGVRWIDGGAGNTPAAMTDWAQGAGGDTLMKSIEVIDVEGGGINQYEDGMIGFFEDDSNNIYFMLTNMYQAEDTSSADTELRFKIKFHQSVTVLMRLNRLTGEEEEIALPRIQGKRVLDITLPGGTGDLFWYPHAPEPATLAVLGIGGLLALLRRRRS